MTLKDKTIKGVKWTTFGSVFNAILQIVQLAILARLLNPTDFGLMAIVMVVIGFSSMFIDMGISNAIIYKQKVSENQLTTLYWLNIAVGIVLFLIILIIAPYIAVFYDSPQLTNLIKLVGVTFVIQPFGQQFMILLQKELNFSKITIVQTVSRFVSFIATIIMAYYNLGVFSLAYGVIIYATLSTILFMYYGKNIYKPKLYFSRVDIQEFLSFGMYQMAEKAMNYFGTQFDTILIGKLLGVEVLGVYNVAKNLVSKPSTIINPVITKVTFPVMSKISEDTKKLREVYLKTVSYLTLVNTPIYLLIALFAQPIVVLMFGEVWVEAIPIVQILAIGFLLKSIGNPAGSLLLSKGKANIAFYWNLITFLLYPTFILYGSKYGINGIAFSFVFLHLLFIYPNWKFIVYRICESNIRAYLASFLPYFVIGTLCLILGYSIMNQFESDTCFIFIVVALIYSILYFTLVYIFKRNIIMDILGLISTKSFKKIKN
ncbi:polysaccharide transporter, PST family/lipopolysaccharide exporter [Lutibacter agarilyticus]|uniref:Polysaccharide transporter, PST family/lipopolysaccharide exporter n=1 Tax=Lutibacter agarilyticus TaxID=1109740 RepID=A0A238YW18_9FLAO|nr:MOP flippase family protein [Lutibacter agarilyticus]SNR74773.1 polysaccharide transporter, PST family/lipopolysaccharide exporter [Lutibacter agarilyticus]